MTHRDFELLARVLKEAAPDGHSSPNDVWRNIVNGLVREIQYANPRFDSAKFRNACAKEDPVD